MKSSATCILTCAALLGSALATQVQQYPSCPLRTIVPSAPGGAIPKPIITRPHGDIMKAMSAQDFRERLAAIAMVPVGNTPEEFTAQVKSDIARWGKVIRESGIKVD